MGRFTQVGRPLTIVTGLDQDALLLVGVRGHEGVSELFRFELDLRAESDAPISFEKLVGRPASVTLTGPGGVVRTIHGLIRDFTQGDQDDDFVHYQAQLVPRFWLLTRRIQSRIFQQRNVKDVLRDVLRGLDVAFELHGDYPSRNYCVQYQESDFAFASRLMEEEGISYYFRHSADGHQLVLTDRALHHPEIAAPGRVLYDRRKDAPIDVPLVRRFAKTQGVGIGRYTVRDYHFELPDQTLEASQKPPEPMELGRARHVFGDVPDLEVFDYPAGHAPQFTGIGPKGDPHGGLQEIFPRGSRLARVRMEAETAPCLSVRGEGNAASFIPGHVFRMDRHPDGDHPYLLLRVEHEVSMEGEYRSGEGVTLKYRNRFEGQPAALAYRPPRKTPRPIIAGPQTAVVVGIPESSQPFLDRYGRVKVQFHWDREGEGDARSSCWVRVSQVWAGQGWGAFFWPRPGHEVIVAFEGGDPDRPIVVGSVYNEVNQPPGNPQAVPDVAGFKSYSLGGNTHTDFNSLVFYDRPGEECVHLHSHKNLIESSESTRVLFSQEPTADYYGRFNAREKTVKIVADEIPWLWLGVPGKESEFLWNSLSHLQNIPAYASYAMGPTTSSTLNARAYTECLGVPSLRFEFDVEALIEQAAAGPLGEKGAKVLVNVLQAATGGASSVASIPLGWWLPDVGGIIDTAFAQRVDQTYLGPVFEIARCKSYRFFGRPLFGTPPSDVPRLDNDAIERAARPAAKALAFGLLLAKTALGVSNHVLNKPGKTTNVAWNIGQGLLNGIVMELLRSVQLQVELTAAMTQTASADIHRGVKATERAAAELQLAIAQDAELEGGAAERLKQAKRLVSQATEDSASALKLGTGGDLTVGEGTIDQTQHTYGEFTLRGTTGVTIETPRFDVVAHASAHDGNISLAARGGRADIKAAQISLVAGTETLARKAGIVRASEEGVVISYSQSVPVHERIALENDSITLSAGNIMGPPPVSLKLSRDSLVAIAGANTITLGPTSISLECGLSKIELTPQGVVISGPNVDITANLSMKLKSLQFENNADAIHQVGAAMQQH